MLEPVAPRALGHVGVTVPDIDAAVAWYGALFGFRLIGAVADVRQADGGAFHDPVQDIFGPELQRVKMAFLSTANGAVLELFEFSGEPCEPLADTFDFRRRGPSHFAITEPDVENAVARIVAQGGRQRSQVWTLFAGLPYLACYTEDPWGNVIELLSHSHEQTFANLG